MLLENRFWQTVQGEDSEARFAAEGGRRAGSRGNTGHLHQGGVLRQARVWAPLISVLIAARRKSQCKSQFTRPQMAAMIA